MFIFTMQQYTSEIKRGVTASVQQVSWIAINSTTAPLPIDSPARQMQTQSATHVWQSCADCGAVASHQTEVLSELSQWICAAIVCDVTRPLPSMHCSAESARWSTASRTNKQRASHAWLRFVAQMLVRVVVDGARSQTWSAAWLDF